MSDQLRNKIQQWEASPPSGAWAFIADAMQEVNAENKLAARLGQYEENPPAELWAIVLDQVQEKVKPEAPQAPVIPMQPLYPYLFRYGAVAILVGLVAWIISGNPFWEKPAQSNPAKISASPAGTDQPITIDKPSLATAITGNPVTKPETEQPDGQKPSNNLPERDPKFATVNPPAYPAKETAETRIPSVLQSTALPLQELPVQKRNQRYIIIYSSAGEPVRLSAKFAPLYYELGQGTGNNTASTAEIFLQKMQQRMIRRPFIPDPNNHFDMIRLLDLLQQEQ